MWRDIKGVVKDKLIEWSGNEGITGDGIIVGRSSSYSSAALDVTVSSPKSITEIFECAGTLLMLYPASFSCRTV